MDLQERDLHLDVMRRLLRESCVSNILWCTLYAMSSWHECTAWAASALRRCAWVGGADLHACESRQRQIGGSALSRFCSNIFSMTRGTMPRFADVAVLWPDVVPIVNVLPEPVWPYASTVALYPAKMPSSRGRTLVL